MTSKVKTLNLQSLK